MIQPAQVHIVQKPQDPLAPFNRPIFVVGLPRSGTSLVAGLLHEFGAWTGETVPGTGENIRGFFENNEIRQKILKPTLRAAGGDATGITSLPSPNADRKLRYPVGDRRVGMRLRMRQIIEEQGYNHEQRWLYKEPKLTLLWRMFDNAFPDAEWVVVRRDRDSFVKSCIKTSFMAQYSKDPKFWNDVGDEYDTRLDQLMKTVSKVTELQTSDILSGDTADLKRMVMGMDGVNFAIAKVRKFVDPTHWHHK
jgi:hypothetical protein